MSAFSTNLSLCGEWRHPRQMLDNQTYDGHVSIHDDKMAADLGFSGAPIEGPTHFSQFVPLLAEIFGNAWFETGCISSHYLNMVVEGEEVRAFAERPAAGATITRIWAEKRDGTPVLTGTASIGPNHPTSELDVRRAKLRPPEQLVILADLHVGQKGLAPESVMMDFEQNMGDLYPFSLNDKLQGITEPSPWYTAEEGHTSPWGRAIIPLEMLSVLTQYSSREAGYRARGPAVGLFADQEIKLFKGPLFVNQAYRLEREIVCLSESRRVESNWIMTSVYDVETHELLAECLLNSATLKDSYANYAEEAKALGKVL
ncbi:MAG: hypothetical protein NWQ11_11865 [Pseudomonadales bacterium]|jgi:hypothetical protein|nr:hypothetical protein [Pseudomonadales bacterium]